MPIMYLWRRLGRVQDPAILSTRIYGGKDRLNWTPLLYLGHGPLGPGKSAQAGARSMTNQLPIRRAGLFPPRTSAGNRASYGQPARKYNMHLCLRETL